MCVDQALHQRAHDEQAIFWRWRWEVLVSGSNPRNYKKEEKLWDSAVRMGLEVLAGKA